MIYVLGSLNMDYVARLKHVPKQGETVLAEVFDTFCGGKGANQAVAVAKLGGQTAMIGHVGIDGNGKRLKENLVAAGVEVSHVTENGTDSGLAMIWVQKGDNRIVVAPNANFRFQQSEIDTALSTAKIGDILITQLEVPVDIVAYALKIGKEKGMTTVLNPAPAVKNLPSEMFLYTDIITPNETETEKLTGVNPVDIVHIALAVKKFYQMGIKRVVLTLGARGAVCAEGNTITEIEARKVKVVDTTAAGDTFVGALSLKIAEGVALTDACRFANCASSLTIQRRGAGESIPKRGEVDAVYHG